MNSSHTAPPESTSSQHVPDGHRGMFASSIDLVQSYSRSQGFLTETLSSSLSNSSLRTRYQANRDQESQWEADDEHEDGRSLTPTGADGYDSDEGPDLSSIDGDSENRELMGTTTQGVRPSTSYNAHVPPTGLQKFWSRRLSANFRTNKTAQTSDTASPTPGRSADPSQRPVSYAERSGLLTSPTSITRYDSISDSSSGQILSADASSTKGPSRHPKNRRIGVSHLTHRRPSSPDSCSTAHQISPSAPPSGAGTSTFGQSLFNGFNILCGVGVLSEPLGFASAGWVGSALVFLFCGLATNYTAKILARAMLEDRSLLTYNDICCKAFGRSMQLPVAGLFCLELFSLSVAMIVIFGDSMATIFPGYGSTLFKWLAFCLVLPTTFMPFKMLSYTSLIGLFSSVMLVSVVIFDGIYKQETPGSIFHPAQTSLLPGSKWGLSFGLIMSGFGGHAVIPSLARDMRNPQDFNRMIDWAYITAGSMYVIVGVAGYLMFGNSVSQEITHDILITPGFPVVANQVAVWMFAINPIAKFALCTRPLNLTIERLFSSSASDVNETHASPPTSKSSHSSALNGNQNGRPLASRVAKMTKPPKTIARFMKSFTYIFSRLSVTILVVVVSIIMPDFDRVMAFLGAFSAFVICVILPVSADLILNKNNLSRVVAGIEVILLMVSVVMAGIGTVFSFLPNTS